MAGKRKSAGTSKSSGARRGKASVSGRARAASKKPRKKRKAGAKKAEPARKSREGPSRAARGRNVGEMKALLFDRREDILSEMRQGLRTYQSAPAPAKGDSSDLAAEALDSDTAMKLAEGESSELAQINAALRSIEEDTYGLCESCGEEIPWGRLKALPYATLCVKCKEMQERVGSSYAGAAGWSAVGDLEDLAED